MSAAKKNPVVIIQARMSSERLPGKTMMEVGGKPLIEWIIEDARRFKKADGVIVAVADTERDDELAGRIEKLGAECARGPSEDVLARFYITAKKVKADPIIRLCADSPLIATEYMDSMITEHIKNDADLTRNVSPMPLGSVHGVISARALEKMHKEAREAHQREHVTAYIHGHPGEFKVITTQSPGWMHGNQRLTIDTKIDLEAMNVLFSEIKKQGLDVNFENAMKVLKEKPEIAQMNAGEKQRNWREA